MDITFKIKGIQENKNYSFEFCLKSSSEKNSGTMEKVIEKNDKPKKSSKKIEEDDEPKLEEPILEEPKIKKEFKIQSSFDGKIDPIK